MDWRDNRFEGDVALRLLPDPVDAAADDAWIMAHFAYHSKTFSLATRLLPANTRLPVATIYLFCRCVDNVADQCLPEKGPEEAFAQLKQLEHGLSGVWNGEPGPELLWQRLHSIHQTSSLDQIPFSELIDGARWDIDNRPIATLPDLIGYSNLVGGSIGAMVLPFLAKPGVDRRELDVAARELGIAMQITNILRDVGEDARALGRTYLPADLLAQRSIQMSPLPNPERLAYRELMELLMGEAEWRYHHGLDSLSGLQPAARLGIQTAARVYREILNEVRAHGYDNLSRRAMVPLRRKIARIVTDGYGPRRRSLKR